MSKHNTRKARKSAFLQHATAQYEAGGIVASALSEMPDAVTKKPGVPVSGVIDTGMALTGDIAGAFTADSANKGQAKGKAIGGGVGAAAGMVVGGPLGAAVGQALGSTVGQLIGGSSDRKRADRNMVEASQRRNFRLDLMENVDPYGGQFEEGGMVGEDPGKPNYRKLSAAEMTDWNRFNSFLKERNMIGSKDLDLRDKALGKQLFTDYRNTYKDAVIDYDIIPHVQNDMLERKRLDMDFLKRKGYPTNGTHTDGMSKVDGWLGSITSGYRYPDVVEQTYHNGNLVSSTNKGLLTTDNTTIDSKFANMSYDKTASYKDKAQPKVASYNEYGDALNADGDIIQMNKNLPTKRFEDGGAISGSAPVPEPSAPVPEPSAPATRKINIEKGELLSDTNGKILWEFNNPNRFSKHAKNQFLEPMGNFIDAPADAVVIPTKDAKRFKTGDDLTRRSIMRKLVSQQIQDPTINEPKGATEQYADGGFTGPGDEEDLLAEARRLNDLYGDEYEATMNVMNSAASVIPDNQSHDMVENGRLVGSAPLVGKRQMAPTVISDISGATAGEGEGIGQPGGQVGGQPRNGLNWGMVNRKVASKLPGVLQGIRSLQDDPYLRPEYNEAYDTAKGYINQLPSHINVDDQLAEVDEQTAQALRAVSEANTPSARAEAARIAAAGSKAKSQILADKKRTETGMVTNKLAQLAGLEVQQGNMDTAEDVRVQNERRMDKAARENIQAAILGDNYKLIAGEQNDAERIKAINAVTKFEDIDPWKVQPYIEDPNARDYIFSYIKSGGKLSDAISNYEAMKTQTLVQKQKTYKNAAGVPTGSSTEVTNVQKPVTKKG